MSVGAGRADAGVVVTRRRSDRHDGGALGLLAAILAGTADLSGAACVGCAPAFDAPATDEGVEEATERHRYALRVCAHCPVVSACRDWAAGRPELAASAVGGRSPLVEDKGRDQPRC